MNWESETAMLSYFIELWCLVDKKRNGQRSQIASGRIFLYFFFVLCFSNSIIFLIFLLLSIWKSKNIKPLTTSENFTQKSYRTIKIKKQKFLKENNWEEKCSYSTKLLLPGNFLFLLLKTTSSCRSFFKKKKFDNFLDNFWNGKCLC